MSETVPSRPSRKVVRYAGIGVAVLALLALAAWYLTSASFQERMRRKVVAGLEQMTGARAELKSFRWSLWRLEFEGRDLTLHGLESPDQVPYAHADRLLVRLKVLSLLRHQIGIRRLELEHPVVHIIVYPDGSTNQPDKLLAPLRLGFRRGLARGPRRPARRRHDPRPGALRRSR